MMWNVEATKRQMPSKGDAAGVNRVNEETAALVADVRDKAAALNVDARSQSAFLDLMDSLYVALDHFDTNPAEVSRFLRAEGVETKCPVTTHALLRALLKWPETRSNQVKLCQINGALTQARREGIQPAEFCPRFKAGGGRKGHYYRFRQNGGTGKARPTRFEILAEKKAEADKIEERFLRNTPYVIAVADLPKHLRSTGRCLFVGQFVSQDDGPRLSIHEILPMGRPKVDRLLLRLVVAGDKEEAA